MATAIKSVESEAAYPGVPGAPCEELAENALPEIRRYVVLAEEVVMSHEWTGRESEIEDADKQAAATLAAALIIRGANMPGAENMTVAAAQAVEIYRFVLDSLTNPAKEQSTTPKE